MANSEYTMRKALAQGGAMQVPNVDGGAAPPTSVTYAMNDNWDPITNGIGDPATFTPMFTVAPPGSTEMATHSTINLAVAEANLLAGCSRVYIRLRAGTYREQVLVASKTSAPPLTIYSTETDASKTTIVFDSSYPTAGSISGSATMTVNAIRGFQMKNITIVNDYVEGSATADNQSGVALLNQADQSQFENVRIKGHISPLYLKGVNATTAARSYFRDSYVEGDEDIILGRGVGVFDHTEIRYLVGRRPAGGIIAAPSTLAYARYGFLFDSCQFTAEAGATGVFLGRQWNEGDTVAPVGKMIVRNSTLGAHITPAAPWSSSGNRTTTPKDPAGVTPVVVYSSDDFYPSGVGPVPAEPYLAEYRNSGPGAHQ